MDFVIKKNETVSRMILTLNQEETIIVDNCEIAVIPVAKWLLETAEDTK